MIVACSGIARPSRKILNVLDETHPRPRTIAYAAISAETTTSTTTAKVTTALLRRYVRNPTSMTLRYWSSVGFPGGRIGSDVR